MGAKDQAKGVDLHYRRERSQQSWYLLGKRRGKTKPTNPREHGQAGIQSTDSPRSWLQLKALECVALLLLPYKNVFV